MIELYILLLFMIAAAVIAVEIRDLLSAVVAVGAVGLALSVAFLVLKAPDLAITQLVVEIICLIILIRATVTRDRVAARGGAALAVGAAACAFVVLFLALARGPFAALPPFGAPLFRTAELYVEAGARGESEPNLVSTIILNWRAYDTLGEATVLFTAVIGVLALLRRHGRKGAAAEEETE
ncbi:MAG: DUF4040 domain-containing protein [bacterium]|nr:DUF4040 domain-containing protein [bacterium]